jgi:hypothetical protein
LSRLQDAAGGAAKKTNEAFRAHCQAGTGDLLAALRLTWAFNLIAMTANGLQSPVNTF